MDAAPAQQWQQKVGLGEGTEVEVEVIIPEFWKRVSSNIQQKHDILAEQLRSRQGSALL